MHAIIVEVAGAEETTIRLRLRFGANLGESKQRKIFRKIDYSDADADGNAKDKTDDE